ncbi:tRNA (uridine-5-oxyacetic acid methyl ester) 34 synthase [hydrothermal vent metagenome]|uniref:tRNA (Uridine-5-oxyacetic acid methyl ester) 34 synthase n=1 Tax=hydrothermal vent metagenome TaxID=652676 RepID=A0A1W1C024_9ZZZZ
MKDNIYNKLQTNLIDFKFDKTVANVFEDMVNRSVPGYQTMLQMMPLFAQKYGTNNSNFYDLGCSLGAVSLNLNLGITKDNINIIAIDNAKSMVEKCRINTKKLKNIIVLEEDIQNSTITNASIVVLNLTLQFINPDKRLDLLKKIYQGLNKGGILLLSEKIHFSNPQQTLQNDLQLNFKRANGYSELEIAQKRSALENTLITDDENTHISRLKQAGFSDVFCYFQCFNFMSFIAIKN